MEKKVLNLRYLLEQTIKEAYERKNCLFLARLVLRIIEQNKDIKFNLDLKTLDAIVYDRLVDKLNDIDFKQDLYAQFDDVSEGILEFVEFTIQRKKGGKL